MLQYLLTEAHCDPNQETSLGETPLVIISESVVIKSVQQEAIQLLLKHKATPPDPTWEKIYLHKPAEAFSKLFLIGFPQAGKSTLSKALRYETASVVKTLTDRFKQVSCVEKDTCGIVPCDITNSKFGSMTIYDLAGHSEFYTSHDIALRNILAGYPSSIVILVADMSKGPEHFKEAIIHWCSFASNLFDCSKSYFPFLIIVGSYADKTSSDTLRSCEFIIDELKSTIFFSKFNLKCFVALDCRYPISVGMTKLRSHVEECCQTLKECQIMRFRDHCFLVSITDKFSERPAITINDIISATNNCLNDPTFKSLFAYVHNATIISDFCVELNKRGNLLFLRNKMDLAKSWIVLQKDILLMRITGLIFTPSDHKDHRPLASNTGIVPASKLVKEFPDVDCDLIISLMTHLQFCHEITDPEILEQLSISNLDNKYLFFPSLVTIAVPNGIWEDQKEFSYDSVWIMKCIDDEQFLSSTLLHMTIHYLAFKYAMAPRSTPASSISIHRRCNVWKNGIYWRSLKGLDIIVELDCKRVVLYIRSRKNSEMKAVKLRSQLISTVLRLKQEYCKEAKVTECFVNSDKISFPLCDDAILVPLLDIAQSLIKCEQYCFDTQDKLVELNTLLHFEPFSNLGESLLNKLFCCPQEKISNEFLLRFAEKAYPYMGCFIILLEIPPVASTSDSVIVSVVDKFYRVLEYWRDRNPTYHQLCAVLVEYSIFAGRNPLLFIT